MEKHFHRLLNPQMNSRYIVPGEDPLPAPSKGCGIDLSDLHGATIPDDRPEAPPSAVAICTNTRTASIRSGSAPEASSSRLFSSQNYSGRCRGRKGLSG